MLEPERPSATPRGAIMAADPDKLQAFVGKMAGDLGAAASAALIVLGDHLGLYKAMA
jgi:hypothetical protein